MKKSAEKKNTFDTAIKTIKYFFPIACKAHKGFFFCGISGIIITALTPFIAIMISPMIIDELMGERDIQKLVLYAAAIVLAEALGMLASSIISIVIENMTRNIRTFLASV